MRIDVFTIFPDMVEGFAGRSLLGKARERGLLDVRIHDLRSATTDPHRSVDDSPYGGGAGMVLMVEPLAAAVLEAAVLEGLPALPEALSASPVKPLAKAAKKALYRLRSRGVAVAEAPRPAAPEAPRYVQKIDAQGRAYATGKRKDAVARVWVKPGPGRIVVNQRPVDTYFARPVLRMILQQPLLVANRNGQYDVTVTVAGGGLSGQAGAVRHGIAKALTYYEPDLRPVLKKVGFLTRDARVVERKKYGRKKARRSFQFSKR